MDSCPGVGWNRGGRRPSTKEVLAGGQYRLAKKYMRQSSHAFPGLERECKREVLGPEPRLYMIASADTFSNRIGTRFVLLHDVKRRLDSGVMEYEQRLIIRFLTNEDVDAHEIHTILNAQFGEQTYGLGGIQFWVREMQSDREDLHDEHRSGRPALDYIDTKIISILEKVPFESARSIAQVQNVDHATVSHRLHEKLGFKSYCLRWVPHLLTSKFGAKRRELTGLIPYLEAAKKDSWRHLVMGDQSCVFLLSGAGRM
jgi:hypothetical protein